MRMSVVSLDIHRQRRSGLRAVAVLGFADGSSCACMLLDLSHDGARIGLTDGRAIPEQFTLRVSMTARIQRVCRLVWQQGDEIRVRFIQRDAVPADPDLAPKGRSMRRRT
jgi:hypothetical protein